MSKLIAYVLDEGEHWRKAPSDLWVTSLEIRQYPPQVFQITPQPGEDPNNPMRAEHDSMPFVFFGLLFDDGSVWDAEFAKISDGWGEIPSDYLEEIIEAIHS